MKIFEGKSPTERNKIIAALVLGVMAFFVLSYTFIFPLFSSKKTITISVSPTPKPSASPNGATTVSSMPTNAELDFTYSTTPVYYTGATYAPEAGRNIFAFYEPPPPTPYSPTPFPSPTPMPELPTPTPTPTPPIALYTAASANGAIIFAGQTGFRLEVSGDKFTPDSQVSVNGTPLPTTYYSPQRLTADIPSDLIANATTLFITVTTPSGLYSNQLSLSVQPQPKPQFQFIGAVLRSGNNNNTGYVKDSGKLRSVRLNDTIERFQVVSIAKTEIVVKDIALGFTHRVELAKGGGQTTNNRSDSQNNPNYNANPNQPVYQEIPGIPNNIPRYNPNSNISPIQQQQQQKQQQQQQQQKDYDDDDDGDN